MSRISLLLVAGAVAAGVVGCAQCDTCDDFPAPCTGPNCGQSSPGILDYLPPGPGQPARTEMPTMSTGSTPMNDAAGPAPTAPPTPPVDPTTPPAATEPAPMPR